MVEIKDKDKEKIDETAKNYSLDLVLLFGSRAGDENKYIREDSDFDVAYLSSKSLNLMDEAKIAGELAKIFKSSNIDIVNIKRANPLLMKQIFDKHKILYCKDENLYYKYRIYSERKFAEAKPLFELQERLVKSFLKSHDK